ncbi:MAG: EthD family reductase [Burkholderiales bacterium]|nr:EthD family reductase [Burkholderiales bacterium]
MIQRLTLIYRKDGMTVEQFRAHWRDVHGPLAARTPGLRRYIQHHVVDGRSPSNVLRPDGIAELWFDTEQDEEAFFASELGRLQREDGRNFVGFSTAFIVQDHEFDLGPSAPGTTRG